MTEEFDEDVVFENSPLFQYLHDLGHTDFEACPTAVQEAEYGGQEGDPGSNQQKGGLMNTLAEALWRWSPFHSSCKLEQQLDGVFGQYSVKSILDQDVLLQEDVELIELLDPSLLTLGSSPGTLSRPGFFATPSSWDIAGLVGLAAVLLGLCSASGGLWSLAAALLGWAGLRAATLWRQARVQRAVHARVSQIHTLVHNSKTLTGLSRKALRLVQETEVISRGFTLVSAAVTFSRAGPGAVPHGQQLMGLRKTLYRALRSAFRASRRATCHMLKAFPLSSEIDNVTNYVSAVPLKELGLGLGIEHLGDEQAQELTDDYSLPALKMLYQLWVGQNSECFRRLALLLSQKRLEEESEEGGGLAEDSAPSALHRSIAAVTEPLHHALAACLGEVQRSYDFHRHFQTQARTSCSDRNGGAGEKCRELNSLHTSIRSLQLHLKAVLSEMIILEDDLEKLMVAKEPRELTLESYRDLSERLHQLQPHMKASTGCWDDTVGQVSRMLRRANACPGSAQTPDQCGPPETEVPPPPPPPSYPLILDKDPVPEEMEWEGYVSDSDSEGERKGSWCDMLTPEERERQRREREESRRVLSELKVVLGFRASDGERMKRKQMLFSDQAAMTPSTCAPGADADTGSAERGEEGGRIPSECTAGNQEEAREGKDERVRPDPSDKPLTEFSCGREAEDADVAGALVSTRGGGGASELHEYDGVLEEGEEQQNGLDRPRKPKVPTLSVMDRLTDIHGLDVLSFSSALAAQVAARSHLVMKLEEQTFGDDDDDDEEEEQ
ncbi:vezatin isoform X2 [Nerophis lumbriciformis]|uniref:vezatin isoform X2 n=1 Tax=Nerophis lumbriciformis TaxID=546530 RepID=UPI002ADF9C00|nr:vezatin-like isoform X2 [Nerophis lumbriciformis]